MDLRIALTGCSGSGKSVLAKWISETYGLEYNPVGSRSVAKEMGFATPYDVDQAGKRAEFQKRLLAAKIEWEASRNEFVTDRSTLDNLVYSMLHDVHSIDADFYECVIDWNRSRYTHVLYCPFDVFCKPDGDPNRVQDLTYHACFDGALYGFLRRERWYTLWDHDLDNRKTFLLSILGSPRK